MVKIRRAALAVSVFIALTSACESDEPAQWTSVEKSLIGAADGFSARIDRFWKTTYESLGKQNYEPPTALVPYDRGSVPDVGCGISSDPPAQWKGNAVYCGEDQTISYEVDFLIEEGKRFGAVVSLLVLAHEWGHHVQHLEDQFDNESLRRELGADCYAGMFASHLEDAGLFDEKIGKGRGNLAAAAASMFFKGHTFQRWFDPGVHGTPRQRNVAFSIGLLTDEFSYCAAYAEFVPGDPIQLSGYKIDPLPGVTVRSDAERIDVELGDLKATLYPRNDLSGNHAKHQINVVLREARDGEIWIPSGEVRDTHKDSTFGGTKAVQPYVVVDPAGSSYGALMLHVTKAHEALVIDVETEGSLAAAGPDAWQPIGDLMYAILKHTCPSVTKETTCLHPLGTENQ